MVSTKVHSNDIYRLFLQAAMSRRVMTESVSKKLWQLCTEAVAKADPTKNIQPGNSQNEWNLFIDKITRMLDPLSLEFRIFTDELTGERMYAIVNAKGDEVAQLASDYNPVEIAFFKAIVEQIVIAPNNAFSVSSLAALREIAHLKTSMTKAQGEVTLASFVARGWLIVTKGFVCATPNCKARLHKHCCKNYRKSKSTCPACRRQWNVDENENEDEALRPIGEAAVKDGQDERRRTRHTSGGDGDDDGDIDESYDMNQTQPSQTQSQSQSQSQMTQTQNKNGKGKKSTKKTKGRAKRDATPESDEEVDDMFEDDTMDIDNLTRIREPASRLHRRS
ncbi:hypothetical protein EW145_g397 [Phellinidium pouzarii]|uniref:Non-structural maintenance of chromosomes element 1 homolog n=1 Tax=Phellinidium pouzarii TaxID=167371 RepID=A0A4S4LKB5_9AGAM|nr:hypothetical protein EW145_g397 [Phellinidium pouzarii]